MLSALQSHTVSTATLQLCCRGVKAAKTRHKGRSVLVSYNNALCTEIGRGPEGCGLLALDPERGRVVLMDEITREQKRNLR